MTVVLGYPQTGKQPSPSPRYPKREAEDNAGRKPCKGSLEGTFGTPPCRQGVVCYTL